jgi:segregation and condensation protein B
MTMSDINIEEVEAPEAVEEERAVIFEEALEAILFAAGHPISYATLARVFDMSPAKVRDLVFEYSLKYNDSKVPRGVTLLVFGDSCQLATKQYYLPEIRNALGIKKNGTLSTSSMEALAIVAYNQPVTRVFVDTLRRADSSYAMNNLIDRGLIECKGRLDVPGRPMLYGTTTDFLRCFGLKDIDSLPTTSEEIEEMFNNAKIAEAGDGQLSIDDVEEEALAADALADAPEVEEISEEAAEATVEELEEPSAEDDIIEEI